MQITHVDEPTVYCLESRTPVFCINALMTGQSGKRLATLMKITMTLLLLGHASLKTCECCSLISRSQLSLYGSTAPT